MGAGDINAQQMALGVPNTNSNFTAYGQNSQSNPYFQTPLNIASAAGPNGLASQYGMVNFTQGANAAPFNAQSAALATAQGQMQNVQGQAAQAGQMNANGQNNLIGQYNQAAQQAALVNAKQNIRGVSSMFGNGDAASSGAAQAALGQGMGTAFSQAQLQSQGQNIALAQGNAQLQNQANMLNAQLGTQANLTRGEQAQSGTMGLYNQYTGTVAPAIQAGLSAADIQKGYGNS